MISLVIALLICSEHAMKVTIVALHDKKKNEIETTREKGHANSTNTRYVGVSEIFGFTCRTWAHSPLKTVVNATWEVVHGSSAHGRRRASRICICKTPRGRRK